MEPAVFGREFKAKTGDYSVRAIYVEFKFQGSKVVLRKEDGSLIEVPMNVLSDADQEYIKDENKRRAEAKRGE